MKFQVIGYFSLIDTPFGWRGGGGGGGAWGITPNIQKISLSPHVPPLFCPKNVDFVIFMQFLVILFKMSPH